MFFMEKAINRFCRIIEDEKGKIDIILELNDRDLEILCLEKGIIPKRTLGKINIEVVKNE